MMMMKIYPFPLKSMAKKKNNKVVADAEAQKQLQKQRERKSQLYMTFRTLFEIQCIYLGLQEVALIDYQDGGIYPEVVPRAFPDAEQDGRMRYIEDKLRDMYAMTKGSGQSSLAECLDFIEKEIKSMKELMQDVDNKEKEDEEKPVILGADGNPVESKNLQKEQSKE